MPKNALSTVDRLASHRDELFIALQRLLPQHLASRLLGKIADNTTPWLKNLLIRMAMRRYRIDLQEAEIGEATAYHSFNAFFTRKLTPTARPIDTGATSLVTPADGIISQIGAINKGAIFQAKNRQFSTQALLGCSSAFAANFCQGSFVTIYLSPRDYHRVHMPMDGQLIETNYIPGKLFSVNNTTTRHIDQLFARNERLVCLFETDFGKMAVVLVGALFVAGIETSWNQSYRPGHLQTEHFSPSKPLTAGDELGLFKFGSTVVVATEKAVNWNKDYEEHAPCKMGRALGEFEPNQGGVI